MDSAIFLFLLFGTADTKNLHPQHIVFHAITIIGYSLHFVNKKFFDLSVTLAGKLLFLEFLVLFITAMLMAVPSLLSLSPAE